MSHYKYRGIKCEKCGRAAPCCVCRPLQPTWAGYPIQLQKQWAGKYAEMAHKAPKRYPRDVRRKVIALKRRGAYQLSRKYQRVGVIWQWYEELTHAEFECFRRVERLISYYRMLDYISKSWAPRQRRAA